MRSLPRPSFSSLNSARRRQSRRASSFETRPLSRARPTGAATSPRAATSVLNLVELHGRRRLVDERLAGGVVQIVLVLLGIDQPARHLGQPPRPPGRRERLQLIDEVRGLRAAAERRFVDGARRADETALKDGPHGGHAVLPFPGRLRQELVDVRGDRLVDGVLLRSEAEADRADMAIGEQTPSVHVLMSSFRRRSDHGQPSPRRRI